ncbi:MAG: triose-phosphate isomerase [Verrucomicrobia bacterium]|nr:MAG: triose-phosphate isomerase [Verrucomicrobiota bacterium]
MKSRKILIAGNWKMNKTTAEGVELVKEIAAEVGKQSEVEVLVCPPAVALDGGGKALEGTSIKLGAQNMHPKPSGAFTGEISAEMIRHHFATYVILGHSERRTYFFETDAFINEKVLAALKSLLRPILCIGETLEERDADKTLDVIRTQLEGGLAGVSADDMTSVVIAYEPVWAIGTGRNATPEQAQEVHAFIRKWLTDKFGEAVAQKVRILYGGSMKPVNAADLLAQEDIDGGLIGGASLEARSFVEIINAAKAAS